MGHVRKDLVAVDREGRGEKKVRSRKGQNAEVKKEG